MKQIQAKLLKVTKELTSIKKSGFNSHQKYYYPTEQDIMDGVKPALIDNNVGYKWSVDSYELLNEGQFALVTTTHTFVDLDSGEAIEIKSVGTGSDKTDKAIFKACTGAAKYAFSKLFMIATDDDPEKTSHQNGSLPPQNRNKNFSSKQPPQNQGFGAKPNKEAAPAAPAAFGKQQQPKVEEDIDF